MNGFESYELTPINLREQIDLREKLGLVVIRKTDDGKTILVRSVDYTALDQTKSTPLPIANTDAVLGFVLDIGIKREKQLTLGRGFYAPYDLEPRQSNRLVTQADFDEALLEQITSSLNKRYQSGDPAERSAAIKANHLIEAYNDARLLYPRFHNESYLGLMRIIDAIGGTRGAEAFALTSATVSSVLNAEISQKISQVSGLAPRLQLAEEVFAARRRSTEAKIAEKMEKLDEHARLTFACFYSAYRYRNKFVHQGFPFPDTVKERWDPNSGMAYLNPVLGILRTLRYSPIGMSSEADWIDIHEVIGDAEEVAEFRDRLFKLIPTWNFVKCMARESLLGWIRAQS
ncbi:MAG: hypothetical protein ACLQAT_09030 [Candidatus Binataceae bacterium]